MNAQTDWNRWGSTWRERAPTDSERLRERVYRKRAATRRWITIKALLTVVMVIVLGHQMLEPATGLIWKIWLALVIVLLLTSTTLTVWTLRSTWRMTTQSVPDMLRLTIKRARVGIRLSWIGTLLFVLLVAVTVCLETWWRASPVWMREPQLDLLAPTPLAVGCVVAAVVFAFKFVATRRLHRELRDAESWLREYIA